jgi:hypothetical protein
LVSISFSLAKSPIDLTTPGPHRRRALSSPREFKEPPTTTAAQHGRRRPRVPPRAGALPALRRYDRYLTPFPKAKKKPLPRNHPLTYPPRLPTVGRDKLLRTIQYFSRFYAWYLYRTNKAQSAIDPYNAIKKQFGTTRKILRIGKFIEHLKAAALALDNKSPIDPVLRYLAIGRQLGYAGYLTIDTITVVDTIGVKKLASAKRLQDSAYKAWGAGLACSAVAGVYTLFRLREQEKGVNLKEGEGAVEAKKLEKYACLLLSFLWVGPDASANSLVL